MSHEWIIESLAELKAYAEQHGWPALAAHLNIAIQIAHLEIAQSDSGPVSDDSNRRN